MTTNGKTLPVLARAFSRSRAKRSSSPATSPLRTVCFDIFSPPPGDSDVISQVDRLSSNEMKIAPRSVRIAVSAWGRSVIICMVASRVGGSATSLCQSVGRYPLPIGSLFVDAEDQRPVGWIEVEPDHVLYLGREVLVARDCERFDQMRLEPVRTPYPLGTAVGDPCSVMRTTCFIFSGVNGLTRDGRAASFNSPSIPFAT